MYKLTKYLNVAKVKPLDDEQPFVYVDCANYDPDLAVNDTCVVHRSGCGMRLAQVMEIVEKPEKELCYEIVTRVDTSAFDERVEQRIKADELKTKMRERAKQLQDIVLYRTLAMEDPEMASLLSEYTLLDM